VVLPASQAESIDMSRPNRPFAGVVFISSVAALPLAFLVVGIAAVGLIALSVVAAALGLVRAIDRATPLWPSSAPPAIDAPHGPVFDQFMSPDGMVVDYYSATRPEAQRVRHAARADTLALSQLDDDGGWQMPARPVIVPVAS
jgi:hypothetical protein